MNNDVMKNKIFLETYGCQMNSYDSELVCSILAKANYALVPTEDEADVVLLNTCAIREHAHQKVYNRIHEIKRGHNPAGGGAGGHPVIVGILGCMATNLRTELLENRKFKIDFIAGPDSYKRLPQLIDEAAKTEVRGGEVRGKGEEVRKVFDITLSEFETYSDVYPRRERGVNAWLAVMRGCNNFCTFCVVPYTRGRERSRSVENVVEETRRLAGEGFRQVTLLGQNVNSYFCEGADFADLLEAVSAVEGIVRIRFTSPHPKDFPEKLLDVVARNPKVCKHIHLPVQSGNNRILELMDRTYTREEFLALTGKIRVQCPSIALTTDIIVGFPSERDEEFRDTVALMRDVEFDSAFIFKYSQRKGTIAARKYPDNVPESVKTERIVHLNEIQKAMSLKKNRAHIGAEYAILIEEEPSERFPEYIQGRTDGNKLVAIPKADHALGDFVQVRITGASANTLKGVAI
ncbi:MAG: tRNA (N6-isopentenyl adenosine(37)-C2)-methylthiotransferase MiaB [Omnitrophica WOR_2 bacterium RIFCSPHIGHO2_02_FULL_50_17]|nr:MAG: tRNA (N6-isopentenyl adenosine(37)-C2)-methylthiotransferase MiaB [Omnitrophica WOR_2 bacterium RIFCSPHIGHO2_02_FULL_50_17]